MSNAIILFSHGSTLCGAGETLKRLAAQMQARGDASVVRVGFLNFSEPQFQSTFDECVASGATSITVVPYFLVAGYFVKVDLPRELAQAYERHPNIEVRVADALRDHPKLADAILDCASRAQPPGEWRNLLNAASQWCRSSEQCPLYGTPKCPTTHSP